ncbi:hypothetical protein HDV05_007568 [Chytridiales sp. JEL 0842]|nr:hypothetical protein HDV05_007568 [Chytridiales sp. JEL 0842]
MKFSPHDVKALKSYTYKCIDKSYIANNILNPYVWTPSVELFPLWVALDHILALNNFYLSTWEEYHTGILFLSECSGPIEGLLIICVVFIFTFFTGPQYWNAPIIERVPTSVAELLPEFLKDIYVNKAIVYFGCVIVIFNMVSR